MQLKLIAAFKIRAIWGTYAARHIARYGCDTFDLVPGQTTVCAVRFRTRRGDAATRRIRLAYVARGDRVGVLVSRVPRYPVPRRPRSRHRPRPRRSRRPHSSPPGSPSHRLSMTRPAYPAGLSLFLRVILWLQQPYLRVRHVAPRTARGAPLSTRPR